MITPDDLTDYLQRAHPDARVTVVDRTGTLDHFKVTVVSGDFDGQNRLNRQRMVYRALSEPMGDGRIHALEVTARTPNEPD